MGRNVMEALGLSKVTMIDGKVVEVTEPKIKYCPLFNKRRGMEELTSDIVRKNMEFRMSDFGMCTNSRVTRMGDFLSFGISEIMSMACGDGMLDAVVIASDGCGTVVLDDPELIQGMGGRISAIIETEPSAKVIGDIGADRLLSPKDAKIDQWQGLNKAFSMGYRKVGVTTHSADQAKCMRDKYGSGLVIFAVHTTGISEQEANIFFDCADIITSCASKWVREVAKSKALLQAGTKVPVYAATDMGTRLILAKLNELGREPDTEITDSPRPLL